MLSKKKGHFNGIQIKAFSSSAFQSITKILLLNKISRKKALQRAKCFDSYSEN